MLDLKQRKQFSNVEELRALLSPYFFNTPVYVNGCTNGYFHVGTDKNDNAYITLDCVDLSEEYV